MSKTATSTAVARTLAAMRCSSNKTKPGFPHVLRTSYQTIDPQRFNYDESSKTLTYRYPLSKRKSSSNNNSDISSLAPGPSFVVPLTASSLLALQDELSCLSLQAIGPIAAGVSLQLNLELLMPSSFEFHQLQELDIRNTATQLGSNVTFTKTEFVDTSTGAVIAVGTHVIYMKIASDMERYIRSHGWTYDMLRWYQQYSEPEPEDYPNTSLQELMDDALTFIDESSSESTTTATMTVDGRVANDFGSMHVSDAMIFSFLRLLLSFSLTHCYLLLRVVAMQSSWSKWVVDPFLQNTRIALSVHYDPFKCSI